MKKSALAVLGLSALISTASFASDNYFSINLSKMELGDTAQFRGFNMDLGRQFGDYIAIEAKLGLSIDDERLAPGAFISVDHYAGIYAKAMAPVTASTTAYVIGGHTTYKMDSRIGTEAFTFDESDYSIGLGADIEIGETTTFNVEFIRFGDKEDLELDQLSVGLTTHF